MKPVYYETKILKDKQNYLKDQGFVTEIIPTSDTESTDRWIILSKDEIHITHRIGEDILNVDRMMYHCLNVMEEEYKRYKECML